MRASATFDTKLKPLLSRTCYGGRQYVVFGIWVRIWRGKNQLLHDVCVLDEWSPRTPNRQCTLLANKYSVVQAQQGSARHDGSSTITKKKGADSKLNCCLLRMHFALLCLFDEAPGEGIWTMSRTIYESLRPTLSVIKVREIPFEDNKIKWFDRCCLLIRYRKNTAVSRMKFSDENTFTLDATTNRWYFIASLFAMHLFWVEKDFWPNRCSNYEVK